MKKITINKWKKELIYYNKSVAWIAPNGKKYSLWSKVPHQNKNGKLVMVDNDKMAIIYYNWISKNSHLVLTDNVISNVTNFVTKIIEIHIEINFQRIRTR